MTVEMKNEYDVVVIGAGPGGLAAAYALAGKKSVLVVESNLWGGTCPNFGCDPKKMLYSVAHTVSSAQHYQGLGLTSVPNTEWEQMIAFKRSYTDSVPSGTEGGLASSGIDHVHAQARFVDAHHLEVDGKTVTAHAAIIATGAAPTIPDIAGAELLETSTDFLAQAAKPASVGFIGAGFVAIELANIAASMGVEAHIIQHNENILSGYPKVFTQELRKVLEAKGVHFHMNESVESVQWAGNGSEVTARLKSGTALNLSHLYAAAGRHPNIDALNLSAAGVEVSRGGIVVDNHLRSSVAHIYAVGDVGASPAPKLTPVAGFEARYCAGEILGKNTAEISYPPTARIVFSAPQLAQVGITLEEAEKHPDRYTIATQDVGSWFTYRAGADPTAKVATVVEKASEHLVGAVVLSETAEVLINYFTALIASKQKAGILQKWIPAYPSVASDLGYFFS